MKKDNADTMVCALDPPIPKVFSHMVRGCGVGERRSNLLFLKLVLLGSVT